MKEYWFSFLYAELRGSCVFGVFSSVTLIYMGCMVQDLPDGRTEEVVDDKDEDCKPDVFRKAGYDVEPVYIVCLKKCLESNLPNGFEPHLSEVSV